MFGVAFQENFFRSHRELLPLIDLFEHIPDALFFAKDKDSRFVKMNSANLAIYQLTNEEEILGRNDLDFHPPALAEAYLHEDRRVMTQRQTIPNQVWLVPYLDGSMQWFTSTKAPLLSHRNEVIGLAGVMFPIETPEEELKRFKQLAPAIRHMERQFHNSIQMSDMAEMCCISSSHFNRIFRELLRMTPSDYIRSLRVHKAQRLLLTSQKPIAEIADVVGYFDQSHFSKKFREVTGLSPAEYRKENQ